MKSKSLLIPFLDVLDALPMLEVGACMIANCARHAIDCVNWPELSGYVPDCHFLIAHSSKYLYVHFMVKGEDLRAVNTANLSPVAQDSCVEFFLQVPGSPEYWNFEFNCIGAVNASHRVARPLAVRLTDAEIARVKRCASCGNAPFEERHGIHAWTLTIAIPFTLIGIDDIVMVSSIMGNFYKCASKTAHPHYLSWAPIACEEPDFHKPEYFAPLLFHG